MHKYSSNFVDMALTDAGFYITETGITGENGYSGTHGLNESIYIKANEREYSLTRLIGAAH